jgi:hypothetical protein
VTKIEAQKLPHGENVLFQAGADVNLRNFVVASFYGIKRGLAHVEWTMNGEMKTRLVAFSRIRVIDKNKAVQK